MKENNKNITILLMGVIIVILLGLCILFTTNTISFNSKEVNNDNQHSKVEKENNNDITQDESTSKKNEPINSNWINYLLSCHILDAKISRIRSIDLGDKSEINKTITITKDDLENILNDLKDTKLFKTYSIGRGGPDKDHLTVSYEYNENVYKFEIIYGTITIDNSDNELKNLLNNNNYEEKNTEYKNSNGSFYFYTIDNFSDNFFDAYFE